MRTLLALVFAVAFGIGIESCKLLAQDGNIFSNATAGVSVTKPAGWHFMTAQQNADNLGRTRLEDREFQEMMQKYATAPLVVMTKYQEPYSSLNPSVKIIVKPLGILDGSNPVAILEIVKAPLEKAFKDFAVVEGPKETELSGLKAGYMRMNYTLATADGAAFPTSSEIWVVPRGSFFFMVGIGSNQKPEETETAELKSIIESIRIEH